MFSTRTTKAESIASISHLLVKSRKVGNNTFEVFYKNGDRAIRLHRTDIVTWRTIYCSACYGTKLKRIVLNTNGWETVTTKARMNQYMPNGHIYQHKYKWYVKTPDGDVPYYDGMILDYDGYHCPRL